MHYSSKLFIIIIIIINKNVNVIGNNSFIIWGEKSKILNLHTYFCYLRF